MFLHIKIVPLKSGQNFELSLNLKIIIKINPPQNISKNRPPLATLAPRRPMVDCGRQRGAGSVTQKSGLDMTGLRKSVENKSGLAEAGFRIPLDKKSGLANVGLFGYITKSLAFSRSDFCT